MQKAFLPPPEILASSKENARRFWENQERILRHIQAFANGWFERRHMGALSACKAAERMCGTESIVGLIQAYQDWAVERSSGSWLTDFPASNKSSQQPVR